MTDAEKVKIFTEESTGVKCPTTPQIMNKNEVIFLIKNVISEMMELADTVDDDPVSLVKQCLFLADKPINYIRPIDKTVLIADQADAAIDAWYYTLNAFAKKGVNLSPVFNEVHKANMNKKFSDGEFHRREDGKVIKPSEWKEPDIISVIKKQETDGSW